jgi:hypothetical protein
MYKMSEEIFRESTSNDILGVGGVLLYAEDVETGPRPLWTLIQHS